MIDKTMKVRHHILHYNSKTKTDARLFCRFHETNKSGVTVRIIRIPDVSEFVGKEFAWQCSSNMR